MSNTPQPLIIATRDQVLAIVPTMPIIGRPLVPAGVLRYQLDRDMRSQYMPIAMRDVIAASYTVFGILTGISNLLAFAQGVHETAGFSSERWQSAYNPAGLGADNSGAWGNTFATPAEGIFAHFAHLVSYALPEGAGTYVQRHMGPFDPRLIPLMSIGKRGKAPRWIDLEGLWAVPGVGYATRIFTVARRIATIQVW